MTLVARFTVDGFGFMLGDALVSVPSWHAANAQLPMVIPSVRPEMEFVFSLGKTAPIGLVQKIVVIGRRLAIGWAGEVDAARRVITDLRATLTDFESRDDLLRAVRAIPLEDQRKVQFLGWGVDKEGLFDFEFGATAIPSKGLFQTVDAIGSGTSDLEDVLVGYGGLTPGGGEPFAEAATNVTALGASLLQHEFLTADTLGKAYGGAYEVLAITPGKFVKYRGAILCFWQVDLAQRGGRTSLCHFIRYGYIGEHLVIHTYAQEKVAGGLHEAFIASPVDRPPSLREFEEVAATPLDNSRHQVINLVAVFNRGKLAGKWVYSQSQKDKEYVKFEDDEIHIFTELADNVSLYVARKKEEGRFGTCS